MGVLPASAGCVLVIGVSVGPLVLPGDRREGCLCIGSPPRFCEVGGSSQTGPLSWTSSSSDSPSFGVRRGW
jgi:hypothetical protein